MKKLIPMMVAAACAFGVYADGFKTVSDFEGSTPGETLDPTSGTLWSSKDTDGTLTFTAYVEADKKYTYGEQTVIADTGVGNNYLAVDNSKPLYRNAADGDEKSIASEDLYIDTLVKFTVTDADTTPEADTNAKLALWLQAGENEGDAPVFKIRCGKMEGDVLGTQDITIEAPEEFDAEAWHRLTVRAVKGSEEYDGVAIAEFKVFLDGEALQEETVLACVAGTGLTGVGFKGNGAIDDVAFADEENAPSFAVPAPTKLTITWDPEIVTGLEINGEEVDASVGSFAADPVEGVVTVDNITCEGAYVADKQTFTDKSTSFVVVVKEAAFTDAEGNKYADFAKAIAAGGTVSLVKSASVELTDTLAIAEDTVIDLAGFTLTIPAEIEVVFDCTAALSIITSVEGGKVVTASPLFYSEGGDISLGGEKDKGVTYDGSVFYDDTTGIVIYGGKFDAENNDQETIAGLLADAETLEAVVDGEYIVVKAKSGPEPKPTYTVTVNAAEGVTVVGAPTEKVEAGDVTLTVTANEGYKNVVVKVGEETITGVEDVYTIAVAADTTVDITVTQITYATVTITPVDNCTITVADADGEAVATGTKFDVDLEVVLTVTRTPATGYELDGCAAEETVTMTEDKQITAAVKSAGDTVRPKAINGGSADQIAAYDAWAAKYDVAGKETAELADAFAINADPEKAADALAAIITADMVAEKIVAMDLTADGEYFTLDDYPNAKFKFVKVDDIDTDANLFKLQAEFVPAN